MQVDWALRNRLWMYNMRGRVSIRYQTLSKLWGSLALPLCLVGGLLAADTDPIKLAVEAGTHAIEPGGNLPIRVNLLNAENQPAKAPMPLSVILQARQPSGKVDELGSIEFATGQSSARAALQPPGDGLVYIWAKHSELLPGGAYVQIRAVHEALPSPMRFGTPPAPTAKSLPEVALRYSPDRPFLANGKDPVTVEAFLLRAEDAVRSDIRLNVFDGSGTLYPIPLTIPAGQLSGRSQLTSTNPGSVTIEYLGSKPLVEISGDKKLSIRFVAPVTHLDLQASPPGISLVDTSDLIVTLTDDQHRPVATDTQRKVIFAIESGQGSLRQQELVIPPGQFEVRTTFVPERSGEVRVSASSPNLLTVVAPLEVAAPVTALVCSLAGGLIGGLLSRRKGNRRNPWRPITGAATGFLFYWACLFLRLGSIANGVALNPLSMLALSMIGGWLQTKVFTAIWPLLQPSRAADSPRGAAGESARNRTPARPALSSWLKFDREEANEQEPSRMIEGIEDGRGGDVGRPLAGRSRTHRRAG